MRTSLRVVPVLLSLLLCALLASPAHAVTPQEQLGSHCVDVHSAQNWEGTICAIVNLSDATGDTFAQALITFQVRSGAIYEVWVNGGLYLRYCQNNGSGCGNQNYEQSPYKIPPGNVNSTFLSNNFIFDAGNSMQARVNTPCIIWTNDQAACYEGVLESSWASE